MMLLVRQPALRVRGLRKAFAGEPVLRGLDLDAARGELLALLGPSGCGKTTALRLVAGFEHPDAGTIDVGGETVARVNGNDGLWVPPEGRKVGHGVPGLRPLPASHRGAQRRLRPAPLVAGAGRPRRLGPENGWPGRAGEPHPRPAFRRPAAARRPGTGAGAGTGRHPPRRALLQSRRGPARRCARRRAPDPARRRRSPPCW